MIVKLATRMDKLESTLVQLEKNTAQGGTDTNSRMKQLEDTVLKMGKDKNQQKIDTFTAMKSQRRSKDDDDDLEEQIEGHLVTYGFLLFCLITWMCICCLFCYARRVSKVSEEERRRLMQSRNLQMTSSERSMISSSPDRSSHMYHR